MDRSTQLALKHVNLFPINTDPTQATYFQDHHFENGQVQYNTRASMIDFVLSNQQDRRTVNSIETLRVPLIAPDHAMVRVEFLEFNYHKRSKWQHTRNKLVRSPKLFFNESNKDWAIWLRLFTGIDPLPPEAAPPPILLHQNTPLLYFFQKIRTISTHVFTNTTEPTHQLVIQAQKCNALQERMIAILDWMTGHQKSQLIRNLKPHQRQNKLASLWATIMGAPCPNLSYPPNLQSMLNPITKMRAEARQGWRTPNLEWAGPSHAPQWWLDLPCTGPSPSYLPVPMQIQLLSQLERQTMLDKLLGHWSEHLPSNSVPLPQFLPDVLFLQQQSHLAKPCETSQLAPLSQDIHYQAMVEKAINSLKSSTCANWQYNQQNPKQQLDSLFNIQQQTLNRKKSGKDWWNFMINRPGAWQKIITFQDQTGHICRGHEATAAVADYWKNVKYSTHSPGPLGSPNVSQEEHDFFINCIQSSKLSPLLRGMVAALDDPISHSEIRQALAKMDAFKRGGVDEEKIKPYKMLFRIWPIFGMSQADTAMYEDLEQPSEEISAAQEELISVFNLYLEAIRRFSWRNHDQLLAHLRLHNLLHLHFKMVTGEILPHRKPNKKQDHDPKAWRPIMCLCVFRKIFTKVMSNRVYDLIDTPSYQMLSPFAFGFKRRMGMQEAIFVVKEALQANINQSLSQYMVFVDVEQAYDSIEPAKLEEVLKLKLFNQTEINVIMNLMTHISAITSTQWGDSDLFPLDRGLPQGDSLSPITFVIFLDSLVTIMNKLTLSSLPQAWNTIGFVDDIMSLPSTLQEAQTLLLLLWKLLQWMGLVLSLEKTTILPIRAHQETLKSHPLVTSKMVEGRSEHFLLLPDLPPVQIVHPHDSIRYLGWKLDKHLNSTKTYTDLVDDIIAKLADIRLGGRVLDLWHRVMQAFINSKINHLSSISWLSPTQAEDLTALVTKKLKTAANLSKAASPHWLYAPTKIGGLGLYPLHLWMKAKQLSTFLKLLHQPNPLVKAAMKRMMASGMAKWEPPSGPPVAYDILTFRPNYAQSSSQSPLYQELADLKQITLLFQVTICRTLGATRTYKYGLLFKPWLTSVPLTTFPVITDLGQAPLWYMNKPKFVAPIVRSLGPPETKPDKQWINIYLLERIGHLETQALQDHILKRHKHCPPLVFPSNLSRPSLPHLYLTDRRVTKEWQVQLWAQRTGELFIPGSQAWIPGSTFIPTTAQQQYACPLCSIKTYNLELHWLLNCKSFLSHYVKGAELLWQLFLGFLRKSLTSSSPVDAIFSVISNNQSLHAKLASTKPALRLHSFWYMDGMGTPSSHFMPILEAMHSPYEQLILDMQRQIAKLNRQILWEGSKKLGAYQCTSLDAC